MMHRYFFKQKTCSDLQTAKSQECCIQIPSAKDRAYMKRMPAGSDEDQCTRLSHMTEVITEMQAMDATLPIMDTDQTSLPEYWNQLFAVMNEGNTEAALRFFAQIPKQDEMLQALLTVHSAEYLQNIISYCIQAQVKGWRQLNSDILITPNTFEVLIKDIATTLFHSSKIHFSFGLPSHHAFADEGSGFCFLNKTALLIKYGQSLSRQPIKHVIVGTDVNRDNGLCDILMNSASDMDVCHVDVFDSRVYPQQDNLFISAAFKQGGKDVGQKIQAWKRGGYEYFAVDLSATIRKPGTVHPALVFALEQIEERIKEAKASNQKVSLYLPTGWDSHEKETAYCGKYIDDHFMSASEARKTRFNDSDLTFFYQSIFKLYHENKEQIERIYWGLEGGYDRTMYEKQIQLLMSLIMENLIPQDTSQMLLDKSSL